MIKDHVLALEWIPVCRGEEIKSEPIQVKVLGETVVLFRTSLGIRALKDMCIHRGARLSIGRIKGDCIVCAYHGWEYDGDGECTKIPQLPDGRKIPKKARAVSYASIEKYGLVWVNLGNNDPPQPQYPYLEDNSFTTVLLGPLDVFANAPRYVEGAIDCAHFGFAHEGLLGDPTKPIIADYEVFKVGKELVTSEIPIYQPKQVNGQPVTNYYVYKIHGPLTWSIRCLDKETGNVIFIVGSMLPIDEGYSRLFHVFGINFEMNMEEFMPYQMLLFNQDKHIVENQIPEELPLDLQAELHLRPDRLSIEYRKMLMSIGVKLGTDNNGVKMGST